MKDMAGRRIANLILLMTKQFDDYHILDAISKRRCAKSDNRRLAVRWMKEVAFFSCYVPLYSFIFIIDS